MITDKLGSYAAARRQIMPAIEHRSHKGLNNRAENSHRRCHVNFEVGASGEKSAHDRPRCKLQASPIPR
jgi:transposase-like protein